MIFIVIWLTQHYGIMGLGFGGLMWLGSTAAFDAKLSAWEYRRFERSGGQPGNWRK